MQDLIIRLGIIYVLTYIIHINYVIFRIIRILSISTYVALGEKLSSGFTWRDGAVLNIHLEQNPEPKTHWQKWYVLQTTKIVLTAECEDPILIDVLLLSPWFPITGGWVFLWSIWYAHYFQTQLYCPVTILRGVSTEIP